MTNFERIKNMTVEEVVDFLNENCGCGVCAFYNGEDECHEERTCREGMELWLEGECELE